MSVTTTAARSHPTRDHATRDHATGRSGFLPGNGLRLHYRELGDPAAPVAVLLPGLMGHTREWDTVTRRLATEHRVIALDHRGHGRSEWARSYSIDALVDDLFGALGTLGVTRADLIGHSLGGMVGFLAAAERPELITRLAVIDIGPESLTSEWARQDLPATLAASATASYQDEDEAVWAWLSGDPLAQEPLLRHYVRHALRTRPDGRLAWRFDAASFPSLVASLDPDALWQAVDRLTVPTLLIRGQHSPMLPADAAQRLLRRLPAGRLVEIDNGGHDLGVQQPEAVAQALHAFLHPEIPSRPVPVKASARTPAA